MRNHQNSRYRKKSWRGGALPSSLHQLLLLCILAHLVQDVDESFALSGFEIQNRSRPQPSRAEHALFMSRSSKPSISLSCQVYTTTHHKRKEGVRIQVLVMWFGHFAGLLGFDSGPVRFPPTFQKLLFFSQQGHWSNLKLLQPCI